MREAAEAVDDDLVRLGPAQILRAQRREQRHRASLHGGVLGVLERQIEELAPRLRHAGIEAARDRALRDGERLGVRGEGGGRAAEHVAGELVEHDGRGERGAASARQASRPSAAMLACRERKRWRSAASNASSRLNHCSLVVSSNQNRSTSSAQPGRIVAVIEMTSLRLSYRGLSPGMTPSKLCGEILAGRSPSRARNYRPGWQVGRGSAVSR